MRYLGLVGCQHVDLLGAVNDVPEVKPRAQLQVAQLERTLQQQNRATPTQGPDALGFGQIQQCKTVGSTQGVERPLNTMSIGVGLHHRPHFGIAGCAPRQGQVVGKGF